MVRIAPRRFSLERKDLGLGSTSLISVSCGMGQGEIITEDPAEEQRASGGGEHPHP